VPAHVLVLDAAEGIGPWARDALAHAGLACALVKEDVEALRSVDAQWPALVVVPLDEVQRWSPVLERLAEGPTTVPVLGVASRDTSVDVTPALALGVEPKERGLMQRKPRDPKQGILAGGTKEKNSIEPRVHLFCRLMNPRTFSGIASHEWRGTNVEPYPASSSLIAVAKSSDT